MSNRNCAPWMVLLGLTNCLVSNVRAEQSPASDGSATVVYVVAERGELRSGPSEEFYPTGYLPRGTSLEVYHHTDDNWLGVRPPAGSFSWVPATDAYLLPGGKVIEIISPAAVSWIGTSLGSAKQYRWQVKLKPGEQLGVLGEQLTKGAEGQEVLWYKVAPPSGEFRWIHANTVSSKPQPMATSLAKPQTPSPAGSSGVATVGGTRPKAKPAVVSAAYQDAPSEGVIVLGEGENYYDSGPQEGDVIYEGEVVNAQPINGPFFDSRSMESGEYLSDGYGDEYVDGEYVDGEYVDGEYVDGGYVDGGYIEGDVVVEDGRYFQGPIVTGSRDQFAGWHALDLDDDGMRLTWLERLYTRARQTGPDPLAADPFSLSMARGTVRPASDAARAQMMMAGDLYEESQPVPTRRRQRGWRDPSTLRGARSGGGFAAPITAPALSAVGADPNPTQTLAGHTPPLAAGLERVSGALASARTALANTPSLLPNDQSSAPAANVNWYGVSTTGSATATATAANLDLNQLQVSLSDMVTQPMHLWSLQAIYESARYYVEHGGSAIERGQARLLMERIEEFADLAQRSGYMSLNRNAAIAAGSPAGSSLMLAGASMGNTAVGVVAADFQGGIEGAANFDASGWLVPVLAASPGQPSHALTDPNGRILAYVSAVPGLNLDRYLNQAVGVTGLRGYLPQLQAGHIQAQRVVRVQ